MKIIKFDEFEQWLNEQSTKIKIQIDARLYRILDHEHFGDAKYLGQGLAELRWKNGLRVYFAKSFDEEGNLIYLILGGNKNGQQRDIRKARVLLERHGKR